VPEVNQQPADAVPFFKSIFLIFQSGKLFGQSFSAALLYRRTTIGTERLEVVPLPDTAG
jgi:hypothetical protein